MTDRQAPAVARVRRLPAGSFFVPRALKRAAWARRVSREARAAPGVLHLTHAGCLDGAASDLVLRVEAGAERVGTLFLEPHESVEALEEVADVPGRGRRLVVTDLSLQRGEGHRALAALARLSSGGWSVEWRDHHARQWDGAPLHGLRDYARLVVDAEGKECGATLLARDLAVHAPWIDRLLAAVRDHDLWLQKDPLGIVLHDAARRLGSAAFVRHLLATQDPEDPRLRAAAEEAAGERRRRADAG
ncbi:MAG TPA: hypothetical protein VI997_01935, partial [Candidatus Thermoplasmatota archaeon]|nr:hypothetical protein [Candidatus Thermoplasmatota archaeon]